MALVYSPNSRYFGIATLTYRTPDGREIAYSARRLLPRPENLAVLAIHANDRERRIDEIGDQYYGDPEQYWRICDANLVFWPPDATQESRTRLMVPLPQEVSGDGDA
ncbi:hypothetical protein MWN34_00355 [Ancylobacter sp. 6x-1]|uniref:Uncharacterized protein n=1 Tax=Ancylobacter crimeensis TaxID=2579147 RepID=A0ABT0D5Y3_9HYPH|nr:hypothetical protein [Ancylobacter crimeensis]MCK0195355.1 hypothetical protein [Ancylobacter crimeensis]